MRLLNYTKLDNKLLREIISFVKPNQVKNFDISFKNSKSWGGTAYYNGCSYHSTISPLVVCRVNNKLKYPLNPNPRQSVGYLKHIVLFSYIEFIVYMTAHELRHLWQSKVKKGWRYWGCRGQFSERDADCYALHKLREWRRK